MAFTKGCIELSAFCSQISITTKTTTMTSHISVTPNGELMQIYCSFCDGKVVGTVIRSGDHYRFIITDANQPAQSPIWLPPISLPTQEAKRELYSKTEETPVAQPNRSVQKCCKPVETENQQFETENQLPNQEILQPVKFDQELDQGEYTFDEIVGESGIDQIPRLPPGLPLWDELIEDVTNAIDDPTEWNQMSWDPDMFLSGSIDG